MLELNVSYSNFGIIDIVTDVFLVGQIPKTDWTKYRKDDVIV